MNPVLQVALWMIPLEILSSGLVCELVRRYKIVHYILMWVVPLSLTPYWYQNTMDKNDWFFIVKFYSVTILAGISVYIRRRVINADLKKKWTPERFEWWRRLEAHFAYFVLLVNIMEAVVQDWNSHRYVNAVTGMLLCLGQVFDYEIHQPPSGKPYYDANWNLTGTNDAGDNSQGYIYPIAYCLWNHAFCYGGYQHFGVIHLFSPFLLSWWNGWDLFMTYRVYALAFGTQVMLSHKNGRSWFFWDKKTYYELYYSEGYYACLQWVGLSYAVFGLLAHQLQLYRDDIQIGHETRVISIFQWLLQVIGVPKKHKKLQ